MPITAQGRKVLASMHKQYGERAEEVFYASINKGVAGSSKWAKEGRKKKKKGSYHKGTIHLARSMREA